MKELSNVKNYVGIDIGKKRLEVIRIRDTKKHERLFTRTDNQGEEELLFWLQKEDIVIMEAGNQSFRIAKRIMREKGNEVIVLNPGDVATIYNSLKKTDKEDALKLARLAQRNPREELPEIRVPSDEEEDIRRLSTEHAFWKEQLTSMKNRLHSLFAQAGITDISKKHLSKQASREKAVNLLPERYLKEAMRIVSHLNFVDENLEFIDEEIKGVLKKNIAYTTIAMSIPGIGPIATLAFLGYIGECDRFSAAKQVSYYTGVVPRVDISGESVKYGKIVKRGCRPIRRVIVQCAWALLNSRYGNELKEFYQKLYPRIGKGKAVVAVSRKMVETFYAMIKSGELFRGVPEEFINKKLKTYGLV